MQQLSRHIRVVLFGLLALLVGACASSADPSAPYFPTNHLKANNQPVTDGSAIGPLSPNVASVRGPIARPNPDLTPGAVAVKDLKSVCQLPAHLRVPISFSMQQAVFASYKISAQDSRKYGLDYLVPLQLGGSTAQANIWPVSTRGVGFHDKESLNARLRLAVCRGDIPLDLAQQQIAKDWFTVWIKYGA